MKSFNLFFFFVFVALIILSGGATALELSCENFTDEKKVDCEYLTSQGFSYEEEQEALNILWNQDYSYSDTWTPSTPKEIIVPKIEKQSFFDTSEFILASKIALFGFFNYVVFSITKSNAILRCLNVG